MKISEAIKILIAEKLFRRTPMGRSLTDFAIENIDATIEDKKNYDNLIVQCKNCRFIVSSLLFSEGCPNCGLKQDLNTEINEQGII